MKQLKYISIFILTLFVAFACETDEDKIYSLDYISAPGNVSVMFDVMSDNTGTVSLFPTAEGATSFDIDFGDDSDTTGIDQADEVEHIYAEGVYTVTITAYGMTGLSTEATQELTVSFNAPENLEITVENDASVSKQINLTLDADYATVFEVYWGEDASADPTSVLPEETESYVYAEAGDYEITVIAKGAAAETTDTTFTVTVTEILAPTEAAPTPTASSANVISIYSDKYTDEGSYYPDWGQTTIVSTDEVDGDEVTMLTDLNYQGIEFYSNIDASEMEYLHIDVWTNDATQFWIYPISESTGEEYYDAAITTDEWVSYDIPLSYFTDLGLSMADIYQFKFVGDGESTVFFDNFYFWKEGSGETLSLPMTFESSELDYTWGEFGGSIVTVVDNPSTAGINSSATAGKVVKYSWGETWGGNYISLDDVIDFSTNTTFQMKVYSPRVNVPVLLKVENNDDSSISYEMTSYTTVANEWETITFDFSGISTSNEYQKLVLFMDYGTVGDGSTDYTYYFDDIELVSGSEDNSDAGIELPLDFESTDVSYSWTDFDGGVVTVMDNPYATGNNTSATVAQMVKYSNKTWGGSYISLDDAIDFSAGTTFQMQVYSPRSGADVLLKVENSGSSSIYYEVTSTTTTSGEWETLTFDYSDIDTSNSYHNIILIFDNGTMGDGSSDYTFYFDNIELTN
jgi:hypothetical protein